MGGMKDGEGKLRPIFIQSEEVVSGPAIYGLRWWKKDCLLFFLGLAAN